MPGTLGVFSASTRHGLRVASTQGDAMAATAPKEQQQDTGNGSAWRGFRPGLWQTQINVRDFIQQNYEAYDGDESFLAGVTERTKRIWTKLEKLFVEERK